MLASMGISFLSLLKTTDASSTCQPQPEQQQCHPRDAVADDSTDTTDADDDYFHAESEQQQQQQ